MVFFEENLSSGEKFPWKKKPIFGKNVFHFFE
jgi:hypothetical protein